MDLGNGAVLATLKDFVVEHIEALESIDDVADDSELSDLGLDSMSALNLLLDIEDEFDVQFPEEYLTPEVFSTPSSLERAIRTLTAH